MTMKPCFTTCLQIYKSMFKTSFLVSKERGLCLEIHVVLYQMYRIITLRVVCSLIDQNSPTQIYFTCNSFTCVFLLKNVKLCCINILRQTIAMIARVFFNCCTTLEKKIFNSLRVLTKN